MNRWLSSAALGAATVGIMAASLTPANANRDDVIRRGPCSHSAVWKLKAKPDNGRIEIEAEVDSNHNGQQWRWRILHNGDTSAHGRATTQAPSGSFEVHRLLINASGKDTIGLRARNPANGEVCRGTLRF
jgi:hypothetical protein